MGLGDWFMDHHLGDKVKKVLRDHAKDVVQNVIPIENLHKELQATDDPVITELYDLLMNDIVANIERQGQKWQCERFGCFVLWLFLDDPAYRHQFLYLLRGILDREDVLREGLEELHTPEPEHWYCNIHEQGEEESERARQDGAPENVPVGNEAPLYMNEKGKDLVYHADRQEDGVRGDD